MMNNNHLLEISDLRVYFHSVLGEYKVVDGVNLTVKHGEILGLAGESGCGKSTVVESIMRLIRPPGYIKSGSILFRPRSQAEFSQQTNTASSQKIAVDTLSPRQLSDGIDLVTLDKDSLQKTRWKYMSYIPQASMNSLNPIMRIDSQMVDVIQSHSNYSREEALERAAEALKVAGLPERALQSYPHELSGGMKQRVIIAAAMTLNPQLIVADEPTTALDVNVQRAILEAIHNVREQTGAAIIFVSHDLAVHAELVDRVAIMYAGKIVEVDDVHKIFKKPLHPYSQRLFASIPSLGGPRERIEGILGQSPDRLNWPSGCRFHPRCPMALPECSQVEPPLVEVEAGHPVACHLYYETETRQIKPQSVEQSHGQQ